MYLNIKCTEKEIELFMFFFKLLSRLIDIFWDLNRTQERFCNFETFVIISTLGKQKGTMSRLKSKYISRRIFLFKALSKEFSQCFFGLQDNIWWLSSIIFFIYLKKIVTVEKYQNIVQIGTVDIGIVTTLLSLK